MPDARCKFSLTGGGKQRETGKGVEKREVGSGEGFGERVLSASDGKPQ